MMHNREYVCRIFCDTSQNDNRLNKFRQQIPYEVSFEEDYSIGLSSISLPNTLLNIREDAIVNFAFFKQIMGLSPMGDILISHKRKHYVLVSSFSVNINKGVYLTHKHFTDTILKNFSETTYPEILPDSLSQNILANNLYVTLKDLRNDDLDTICSHIYKKITNFARVAKLSTTTFKELKKMFKSHLPLDDILDVSDLEISENAKVGYARLVNGGNCRKFWLIPELKNKLRSPLYNVWFGVENGVEYAQYIVNRQTLRNDFIGARVFQKLIDYFIKEVWVAVCWSANANFNERRSKVLTYEKRTATRDEIKILEETLLEITKIYFNDLAVILDYIHKTTPEGPYLTLESFLNSNKVTYMYNQLRPTVSQEKQEKLIRTELAHFLKRLYYDETRLKVVFSEITQKYNKIRVADKLSTDLTMLNSHSPDVAIFLGDNEFVINKSEHVCTFQPRICSDTEIFIYLKQITEQYVNSRLVPLFHVLHSGNGAEYGQILQQRYPKPLFLKLNNRYLRELDFEFRTRDGQLAMFDHSADTISMVVVLRPSSRGCI